MAKYENIRALAKKQLQTVTESSDRWKEFLRTAAIAYNYSFPNQDVICRGWFLPPNTIT